MDEASREWFFMNGAERVGPIPEADLQWRIQNAVLRPETPVWTAGMPGWEPAAIVLPRYARADESAAVWAASGLESPVLFPVSTTKFVVMSIVTFGVYDIYWSYRNWAYLKAHDGLKIRPAWRAWFVLFFHYHLIKRMKELLQSRTAVAYNPLALYAAYIAMLLANRLPEPYFWIGMLSFVALLPVVSAVESANASVPAKMKNARFTAWNVVGIVAFCLVMALAGVGLMRYAG